MILHIGRDVSVFAKDVVMILDAERANDSPKTRQTLEKARENGNYFRLCEEVPKSYVIVKRNKERPVLYTSNISASTLYKRCLRRTKPLRERKENAGR